MRLERHVLADRSALLPMPDRGGRLFSASDRGETIDVEHPFWAARIFDGEIVPISPDASRAAPSASRDVSEAPPPVAPAGRATTRGRQSAARPAAGRDTD